MSQISELRAEVERLQKIIEGLGIIPVFEPADPTERGDYVEPGSERHAEFLGLRKATDDDTFVVDGWTLVDLTVFGVTANPDFVRAVLAQKVSALTTPQPVVQSEDPLAPNYAPPMWQPDPIAY